MVNGSNGFTLQGATVFGHPGADAVTITDSTIAWIGDSSDADRDLPVIDVSHLGTPLLAPAFVDSHVHLLLSGRAATGVDLAHARSLHDVLDLVAERAGQQPGVLIHGQGWDHTDWAEGRPPTISELDRAGGGAPVYLTRVEHHSAMVSTGLIERLPGLTDLDGFDPSGWIKRDAFAHANTAVGALFTDTQRVDQLNLAISRAATQGISTVHEMAAPHLNTVHELSLTREVAAQRGLRVHANWGELATPELLDWARTEGLLGLGGDLNTDGAIGSRTACVSGGYHDEAEEGFLYLDEELATQHVIDCTRAGLQAGFHCIGDRGVSTAARAIGRAGDECGLDAVRQLGHRLEHAEMLTSDTIRLAAHYGMIASVQPMFDALWAMPGGLYEQRLGERYPELNPFAEALQAGVRLAFGSDSPVTGFAGWQAVQAAVRPWNADHALTVAEAFDAATVQGHRAAHDTERGKLRVGAPADLALHSFAEPITGLPRLDVDQPLPTCLLTLADGRVLHDPQGLLPVSSQP